MKDLKKTTKYTSEKNTFSIKAKEDNKDLIEVEVGDIKQEKVFYPQAKIKRWDNEVNCSFRLVHDETDVVVSEKDGVVNWKGTKKEVNFYQIEDNPLFPEGGSEIDVTLLEKPDTDEIKFTVVDKGVKYYYQPEISDEEAKPLVDSEEEWFKDIDTLEKAKRYIRPENVVGSYAIYTSEEKINIIGEKEYKSGKIGHIYRPRMIDAEGTMVWGSLNIEKGIMTVTIPQDFLDNAVYPIRHSAGATVGYTSVGSSNESAMSVGSKITGAAGTLSSISVYGSFLAYGPLDLTGGLYDTDYDRLELGDAVDGSSGVDEWLESDGFSETIASATSYWLYMGLSNYYGGSSYKYDSGSTGQGLKIDNTGTPTALTGYTVNANKYSMYATYTASGGSSNIKSANGLAIASLKGYNGVVKASIKNINGLA